MDREATMRIAVLAFAGALMLAAGTALAGQSVELYRLTPEGTGASLGTVELSDTGFGLLLAPDLTGLEPGEHGIHIHTNPDCGPAEKEDRTVPGLAAGGHFDPEGSGRHKGPYGHGHLGDLALLWVSADGRASHPIQAPRLSVAAVQNRALIVHGGGDNYSDEPAALGGGGARVACGIIR
jgi:superoxide dismutase, Cu-Zn family